MTPCQTRALFSGLSAELAAMMEAVDGLSALVDEHARLVPSDRRSAVLIKAQAVDDLHQKLDSLRALSGALSDGTAIEDALANIPLSALAHRLQDAALSVKRSQDAAAPGEVLLFD